MPEHQVSARIRTGDTSENQVVVAIRVTPSKNGIKSATSPTRNAIGFEQHDEPSPSAPLLDGPAGNVRVIQFSGEPTGGVRMLEIEDSAPKPTSGVRIHELEDAPSVKTHVQRGSTWNRSNDSIYFQGDSGACKKIWTITKYSMYFLAILSAVVQLVFSFLLFSVGTTMVTYFNKPQANIILNQTGFPLDFVFGEGWTTEVVATTDWPQSFETHLQLILSCYLISSLLLCYGLVTRFPWSTLLAMLPYCISGVAAIVVRLKCGRFPQNYPDKTETLKQFGSGIFWGIFVCFMVYLGVTIAMMVLLVIRRRKNRW